MVKAPKNYQTNKQTRSVRTPVSKPLQTIEPRIPELKRNGFTPESIKVPVLQPVPTPKTQSEGAKK